MPLDLDTFLTAVYVIVDQLYQTQLRAAEATPAGTAPALQRQ